MTAARWRSARLVLGTASALGFGRFAYGLLLPAMVEQMRWDLARAGTMTAANGLGYLVGALATAPLAGRLGAGRTFRAGMVLCAAALATTAAPASYPVLLAGRALAGFAGALVFVAGAVLAPTAAFFAGAGVGIALSGAAIPPLLDHHPERWPLGWLGLAAAAGLATAVTWTAARPGAAADGTFGPASAMDAPVHADTRRRPAIPAALRPLALVYLLFGLGYITHITFLSAYLADRNASAAQTALTWALLGLAVVAAPALWRRPVTRWPGTALLAVLLAAVAGAAALPLLYPAPPVVLASALGYGASFMLVPAVATAIVRAAVPAAQVTSTLAALTAVFAAGQAAGPWLAGAVADRTGTGAALAWTTVLCGAGALVVAAAARGSRRAGGDRVSRVPDGSLRRWHGPPRPGRDRCCGTSR